MSNTSYNMIGLIKAAGLFSQRQSRPDINSGVVHVPAYAATIPTPIPTSKPVVAAKPATRATTKPAAVPKVNPNYRKMVKNPGAGEMDEDERYVLVDRSDGSSPASRGERY